MAAAASLSTLSTVSFGLGSDLLASAGGLALTASIGAVSGCAIYLAFLPPKFYTNWVAGRPREVS